MSDHGALVEWYQQVKTEVEYLEKTYASATSSTTNAILMKLSLNLVHRDDRPVTNSLIYGPAFIMVLKKWCV
jgi:hypothetical protein